MDERLRFLLYGTYDGFSRNTLGDDNILLVLDNGDKVEIPSHFVKNASDFVEKNQIKLKDVTARIKQLDIGTRKVWLDEFLNELGSDFGSAKYKDGYEQGKLEGEWIGQQLKDADKIRQELNKPVVKQFVADWYEENKDDFEGNLYRCPHNIPSTFDGAKLNEFERWFLNASTKPFQTLVNMHQFGYEVEKEKRYFVKIKATKHCFARDGNGRIFFSLAYKGCFTKKELEDANFGWVFDCEGIEIEEVE